jgi:hypothetical protein
MNSFLVRLSHVRLWGAGIAKRLEACLHKSVAKNTLSRAYTKYRMQGFGDLLHMKHISPGLPAIQSNTFSNSARCVVQEIPSAIVLWSAHFLWIVRTEGSPRASSELHLKSKESWSMSDELTSRGLIRVPDHDHDYLHVCIL